MTPTHGTGRTQLSPIDIAIVLAGVASFVLSFFGYYTATVSGHTRTTGAWHGFYGWFAAVIALLGAVLLVVALAVPGRRFAPPYRTVLVIFTAAALSVLAALFTSGFDTSHALALGVAADTGHGYAYWTSFALVIAATAMTLVRVLQTRGGVPDGPAELASAGPASQSPT